MFLTGHGLFFFVFYKNHEIDFCGLSMRYCARHSVSSGQSADVAWSRLITTRKRPQNAEQEQVKKTRCL